VTSLQQNTQHSKICKPSPDNTSYRSIHRNRYQHNLKLSKTLVKDNNYKRTSCATCCFWSLSAIVWDSSI